MCCQNQNIQPKSLKFHYKGAAEPNIRFWFRNQAEEKYKHIKLKIAQPNLGSAIRDLLGYSNSIVHFKKMQDIFSISKFI